MSRTKQATIVAAFGYAQFALAILVGIAVVPLMLDRLGTRTWGIWLATGELLAYVRMADLGILSVLPWLFAAADGRSDRPAMQRLVSNGIAAGAVIGCVYALLAVALWQVLPSALRLSAADRATVGPPLAIIVGTMAVTYPLRAFPAALMGLQDATFVGALRLVQVVLELAITIGLLLEGYGLYALAWASAVPTVFSLAAAAIRLRQLAPDLMRGWTRPTFDELRPLIVSGFGVWLAGFGWLLLSSTNALVITFLGHPEWVAVFACTAKVSVAATQLVWLMPDSGLVGLAHLHGEQSAAPRVRHAVGLLQQVHLLLAGAAACAILAFNAVFVARWVGEPLFGGLTLNALLAFGIVLSSLVHGLVTAASVLGNRVQVGIVTLVNGVVQVAAAIVLGRWFGLVGVVLAGLIAASVTSLPAGLLLLNRAIGMSPSQLIADRVTPWMLRAAPIAAASLAVGLVGHRLGLWLTGVATLLVSLAYVWHMRPLYGAVLRLNPDWSRWLAMVGLLPPPETVPVPSAMPVVNRQ